VLASGLLADEFGRRHVTMMALLVLAVSSLALYFVKSYALYAIFSFFSAIGQSGWKREE
jgi:MFS family permease